jgi:hypothetical protein
MKPFWQICFCLVLLFCITAISYPQASQARRGMKSSHPQVVAPKGVQAASRTPVRKPQYPAQIFCFNQAKYSLGPQGANFTYRICHVPDIDQRRAPGSSPLVIGLPNEGKMYCAPTAAMNWMAYIASHGYPQLQPYPGDWQLGPPSSPGVYNAWYTNADTSYDHIRKGGHVVSLVAADQDADSASNPVMGIRDPANDSQLTTQSTFATDSYYITDVYGTFGYTDDNNVTHTFQRTQSRVIMTPHTLGAAAQQTQFTGFFGIINGCNGEAVVATGTVKITYHANQTGGEQTHYNINLRFKGMGEGSLGNHYHMSFIANGQFDSPTQDFGSFQVFDLPYRSVFLSQGQAPNIEVQGTIRVFVAGGQALGALITSITATTCHG